MRIQTVVLGCLLGTSIVAIGDIVPAVLAQSPEQHRHGAASPGGPSAGGAMPMHAQMMDDMRARQAKLEGLVKTMDGATGQAKVDAIAAIIRELVQHEKAMAGRMESMHEQMMPHAGPTK
jgi:hypothetical protein